MSSGMILARLIARSYSNRKVVLFGLQALVVQVSKLAFSQTGLLRASCTVDALVKILKLR